MPVGLDGLLNLKPVAGLRLAATFCGVRKTAADDLALIELAAGSRVAAVFTRNAFCAAPVVVAREHLAATAPRYLLVNAGNANAGTGESGLADAHRCCQAVARLCGCDPQQVLPFSTGVIGESLPVDKISAALPGLQAALATKNWPAAARAIMTTDTVPKGLSRQVSVGQHTLTVTGMAKGAGMIRPDMATMLAYIGTDAAVRPELLERCLQTAVECSFNRITVDGDTSTNDACVLLATGCSELPEITREDDPAYVQLCATVTEVCVWLAQAIVRDAEGVTKFVTIKVDGASSRHEALTVAYTVAHSPLVKTAFNGCDPNWGRILAAVGRAGIVDFDITAVSIFLDAVCIVRGGGRDPDYRESDGQTVMARDEVTVRIDLGRGDVSEQLWTSDLSCDYVRINADYRT